MITMKFGGTSVGSAERIRQVCHLVKNEIPRHPIVVVSAHNSPTLRMTDTLVATAQAARNGIPDTNRVAAAQRGICQDLGVDSAEVGIETLLERFDQLIKGIAMIGELTPRTMDMVMSFGERMSARVVNDVLRREFSVNSEYRSAVSLGLRTDRNFGAARPDPRSYPKVARAISSLNCEVLVTTGFIGATEDGQVTTLGRGGSDYSGTIFGAIVGAEEVQIWTDVSGVMTTDPRIVPEAKSIPELTFMEASELAWYGAKVLHPATMLPAIDADIPVRVKNTADPDHPGTVIRRHLLSESPAIAKSLAVMNGIQLVNITTGRMFGVHGFMARIFEIFSRNLVEIHMIATSEVTVSITTPKGAHVEKAADEIKEFADVTVERGLSLVSVVGEKMKGTPGVAARATTALARAGVNIRMISQGATEINIAMLVQDTDASRAVVELHREFFA
ncbi:MAG: aspartate kinase [Planctomycetota bacterium]|jgi:aspartate kinase|nr:aspartate kinase [Planctomycetota bacterium]